MAGMSVRVGLSSVPDHAGLLPGLSVAETVTLVLVIVSGLVFLGLAGTWLVLRRSNRRRGGQDSLD